MADFDVVLYKKLEEDKLAMPSDLNLMRFKNNAIAYLGGSDILQKYIKEYGGNGYAHMQIIKGFVQSAHFGLDFLNNEAYLIPYKEKLDFMPSYKGLVKLCMRYSTRPIKTIYAKLVKEGDTFEESVVNGEPSIDFHPKPFNDGKIIGAFAVCLYKDGGMVYESMSLADLEQCHKSSKAPGSPAWSKFRGEMFRKVVLRRLSKQIPIDIDEKLAEAMNAGLEIETDPAKLAEREREENGNTEELAIDVESSEVTT